MTGYVYTTCRPSYPDRLEAMEASGFDRAMDLLVTMLSRKEVPFYFGTLRWCIAPMDGDTIITLVRDRNGIRVAVCRLLEDHGAFRQYEEVEPTITPEMMGWPWHLMRLDV